MRFFLSISSSLALATTLLFTFQGYCSTAFCPPPQQQRRQERQTSSKRHLVDPEAFHHLVQNGVDAARVVFLDCDNNNHECNMVEGIRVTDYGRGDSSGWLMQDKLGGGQSSYYYHHDRSDGSFSSSGHTTTLLMMEMDDTE